MCIEEGFKSIEVYTDAMAKTIKDKLFFIDKLPDEEYLYVDFGCANGVLLTELRKLVKGQFIGYDINEKLLSLAKENDKSSLYTKDWDIVKFIVNHTDKKSVLILSSVIHEVYSYAESKNDILDFWNKVLNSNFNYIVIRDMIPNITINRISNPFNVFKARKRLEQVKDFEKHFGSIWNNENLVHYLLKYRYTVNWDREVKENYFPMYLGKLLRIVKDYDMIYLESFKIPFLVDCVKRDFGIDLKDNTHVKLIVKNNV